MSAFKQTVRGLYAGSGSTSVKFRYVLIMFDAVTIVFFVGTAHMEQGRFLSTTSFLVGVVILMDFSARLWIAKDRRALLKQIYTLADLVVVLSLLLDPLLSGNLAFLRILRGLRLIHSYHLLRDLRRDSPFFRTHEDAVIAAINLLVFVFVTATSVRVFFIDVDSSDTPYIDALYFTIATLTTTGFGDITLITPAGKLFSVFIMVVGVALFVRLAQAIFSPQKVRHRCKACGLYRHDPDAVHCKHCGEVVNIETGGVG
ncbi:potassium channel family protein [Parasedimentitalea psychrophila]|uniref:Potassium channel family protein n=1 Tax=Parasedimentitalea psychrophila TaxID=2997337 RepID=A0A9Y2KZW7_9RHOB|nr:potassium channel family protein [Parasedimentitalea psychrophila]WIY24259.1 potassium channel family protein [Parasedimentitalea psychrophila]